MSNKSKLQTQKLVLGAVMTGLVIILQLLGSSTTFFGPFSTAVALIPIVLGAAMCGTAIGAWLGFVFGMVVILSGGAALFFAFNVPGTIITVLLKGTACGLAAGFVYKLLSKYNKYFAVLAAAIVCPFVNTGMFLLGCYVFFMDSATQIALYADTQYTIITSLQNSDKYKDDPNGNMRVWLEYYDVDPILQDAIIEMIKLRSE